MKLPLRSTVVVHGRLAMRRARLEAARASAVGLQVMAFEHMASRLAGGFNRLVSMPELRKVVADVLPHADLGELDPIKGLPGMPTAAAQTLMRAWLAGVDLSMRPDEPRLAAVASLEAAVRAGLPRGVLTPVDVLDAARARIGHAEAALGHVTVRNMTELHPVWRPLLSDLAKTVGVTWDAGPRPVPEWLDPAVKRLATGVASHATASFSCATPRHEVIEAVRWARELMATGVDASSIAIATASTTDYDELFTSVASDSGLPIHFDHGLNALETHQGQAAAALADVLLRGLSQKRVRRLVDLVRNTAPALKDLPDDWTLYLPPDAALTTAERWRGALTRWPAAEVAAAVMEPVIEVLDRGADGAEVAGDMFLTAEAHSLWTRALTDGPATALDRTVRSLRVSDGKDPFSHAAYMSAETLAANPRPHVRLIGLSSRAWPRGMSEDALIPSHVIPSRELDPLPTGEADRRDFRTIVDTTSGSVSMSWPRRDPDGRVLGVSPLVPDPLRASAVRLQRTRVPVHALSEADRLFARPDEFRALPAALHAASCWSDWHSSDVTPHDGMISLLHPRIERALDRHQSATSLQKLLRDPLGFVWQYALGFTAPEFEDEPLTVDPRQFGNLLHQILRHAVDSLEATGGFATASELRVARALNDAVMQAGARMETSQPIPPHLIWRITLDRAQALAQASLGYGLDALPGQRTFTEVPFGGGDEPRVTAAPWDPNVTVRIPGSNLKIRGVIDRLDLSSNTAIARVIDYKSGKLPKDAGSIVLKGGEELQRCLYGFAVKELIGSHVEVEAALLYPKASAYLPLPESDETLGQLAGYISTAVGALRAGACLPGEDAKGKYNDLAFALPANPKATYLRRKGTAIEAALGDATEVWSAS